MLRISEVWSARALLVFVTLIWGTTFTLTKPALSVPPFCRFDLPRPPSPCRRWAQERLSPTQIALTFTLEPVFAAAIGWVALRQTMSWTEMLGGLWMVTSMAVAPA